MKSNLLYGRIVLAALALAGCSKSNTPTPQLGNTTGSVSVYPGAASVPLGGSVNFTANLTAQPTATFTWSISSGTGNGSINANTGVYTAPASAVPNPATITVTAKSGTSSGTANITITAAQPVTVSPSALFVPAGASVNFTASSTVTQWQVNGAQGGDNLHGHITPGGTYTAPLTPPPGGSTVITAITASGSGTANATVVFSSNSLNGPYAFSYSGSDKSGFFSGAGSFTANGANGTISGGIEDVFDAKANSGPSGVTFNGSFTVGPDGTCVVSFNDGTGAAILSKFRFLLTTNTALNAGLPAQQAFLLRVDANETASGTLNQQNLAVLSSPLPLPAYAFGFSGVDSNGNPVVMAGKFVSNSGFSLSPGVWDVSDPSFAAPVTDDTTLTGTSVSDASHPGTGRGTLTLITTNATFTTKTFAYTFYVVDQTHLKVIENDGVNFTFGDIFSAPNTNGSFNASSLNGNYAFVLGGGTSSGAYALAGVFTANGGGTSTSGLTGNISAGVIDQNGGVGNIAGGAAITASSYTVDATNGRITLSLSSKSASSIGNPSFALYATSSGTFEMVETDSGHSTLSGTAYTQTSTAALQGGFAANFAGIANSKTGAVAEDVVAQFAVSNSIISYGTLNINNLAGAGFLAGEPITQAVIENPDPNGRGTATFSTSPASYSIVYYMVDANSAVLMETDGQRVTVGNLGRQF